MRTQRQDPNTEHVHLTLGLGHLSPFSYPLNVSSRPSIIYRVVGTILGVRNAKQNKTAAGALAGVTSAGGWRCPDGHRRVRQGEQRGLGPLPVMAGEQGQELQLRAPAVGPSVVLSGVWPADKLGGTGQHPKGSHEGACGGSGQFPVS